MDESIANEKIRGRQIKCPVQSAVSVIGGKWKPGILFRLQDGPFRFGVLKRQMPWISERVLIRQLKELEAAGVVKRQDYREVPPRVDYSLTEYGRTLEPILQQIGAWGATHLKRAGDQASTG